MNQVLVMFKITDKYPPIQMLFTDVGIIRVMKNINHPYH